jgi:ribonuclease P protein component
VLRRRGDFEALGRLGTARGNRLLVLRWRRTDGPATRIGLSTPRSLGGAVERNRVRRRLRELVRRDYPRMGSGWDLLVIARPEASRASWEELGDALASLLARADIGR